MIIFSRLLNVSRRKKKYEREDIDAADVSIVIKYIESTDIINHNTENKTQKFLYENFSVLKLYSEHKKDPSRHF